eukprot:1694401-Alexandrium_andersonii.AAC.1
MWHARLLWIQAAPAREHRAGATHVGAWARACGRRGARRCGRGALPPAGNAVARGLRGQWP